MTKSQKKIILSLLREVMLARDGHRCQKCRTMERLQMSHIYPKGKYRKLELEIDNVVTLCTGCHLFWWHKNPLEAGEWIKEYLPTDRYNRLKLRSQVIDKSPIDYNLLKLYLEQELKKYEQRNDYSPGDG